MAEGSSEERVRILAILPDDHVEVIDGLLVILNHLVRFRALMDILDLGWHMLNTLKNKRDENQMVN